MLFYKDVLDIVFFFSLPMVDIVHAFWISRFLFSSHDGYHTRGDMVSFPLSFVFMNHLLVEELLRWLVRVVVITHSPEFLTIRETITLSSLLGQSSIVVAETRAKVKTHSKSNKL